MDVIAIASVLFILDGSFVGTNNLMENCVAVLYCSSIFLGVYSYIYRS